MRISGFHVDGFGALADFGIDDLSPGLVILNGPNEAGKSTLLDFLTVMLFGFPSRRDNPRFRAPVRGGRHGGQLTLAGGRGEEPGEGCWRIERYAAPRKSLSIRRPDGGSASEEELRRALGGADEALFRAVFAVDLTELGSGAAMTRDEVRELLFSASIVGQRRSAARAMASLQKQRLELARSRQGDARANRLLAELESVRRSLGEAGREAAGYPARKAEVLRLEVEVAQAREEADRIDHRRRDLDLLVRLWDVLERKKAAEQRLATSEEPTPVAAWLEEQTSEIQSLRSACSGHLQQQRMLSDLCNQRGGIEQSIQAALGSLGPRWDRERVRNSEGWIGLTDEGRRFRASLAERESQWHTASVLAAAADASPELAGLPEQAGAATASSSARTSEVNPDQQARLLSELRRNLAEHRRLVAERQASELRGTTGALGGRTGISIAFIAVVIAVLGVVAALVSGVPTTRLLCVALAAAACTLLTLVLLARRRIVTTSTANRTDTEAAWARVAARVAELATSLGLPGAPSDSDLETAAEEIEAARSRERSLEDQRHRTAAALERRKVAHESLERASGELEAERARFGTWKAAHGLGAMLSADGALESLAALQTAWEHLGALDRVNTRIGQLGVEIAAFQVRLDTLAGGLRQLGGHLDSLGTDPAGTLEELNAVLEEMRECRTTRASILSAVEHGEAELERSLGLGPEACRLRAELESGGVLAWNEEQAALARARSDSRQNLEGLVRAHQDSSNQLRTLAGSAQIAQLEQTQLSLEEELDEVLQSWALLGCARLLLERTLRRHEQERQPAVLARAGERFTKVTEGRYVQLLPSVADEGGGEAIRVVSASGAELEASALSRGSIEQLYLCLRIGLAETFAERAEALPLILDDVLVNFDPERAASIAEVLAETAERHQVLFFTCHPHLGELVQRVAPQAQLVRLERA
ncbi:MAG: AAA family ATPase [Acidimicrobiales bacterium]|jgi:uncharacterized protein YhaN